ncbi:hypothetical protein J7K24_01480 [bacterium]|nr:hypothetical protein [bacterium]
MNENNDEDNVDDVINAIRELNRLYRQLNPDGNLLQEIGETVGLVRGFVFVKKRRGIRYDKYSWFWGLDFFDGKRWLTILFPWATESNDELDRSIIVLTEAPLEDVCSILKGLIIVFRRYIKKENIE